VESRGFYPVFICVICGEKSDFFQPFTFNFRNCAGVTSHFSPSEVRGAHASRVLSPGMRRRSAPSGQRACA